MGSTAKACSGRYFALCNVFLSFVAHNFLHLFNIYFAKASSVTLRRPHIGPKSIYLNPVTKDEWGASPSQGYTSSISELPSSLVVSPLYSRVKKDNAESMFFYKRKQQTQCSYGTLTLHLQFKRTFESPNTTMMPLLQSELLVFCWGKATQVIQKSSSTSGFQGWQPNNPNKVTPDANAQFPL